MRKLKFIEKQLIEGEEIKSIGEIHWLIVYSYYCFPLMFVLSGMLLLNSYVIIFGLLLAVYVNLAIKNLEIALTNKRFILKFGVITRKTFVINLNKIESCNFNQGVSGRMFNYAFIDIKGVSGDDKTIKYISNYQELVNKINEEISNMRK